MIRRFLIEHREWAGLKWQRANLSLAVARTTSNRELVAEAIERVAEARRSLRHADLLLDLWTLGGRR